MESKPSEQKPSVGRVVHYTSYGTPGGEYSSVCRSAEIAEVGAWIDEGYLPLEMDESGQKAIRREVTQVFDPEACALVVKNPTGLFFNTCRHNEDKKPGTWHWPERV